MMTYDNCCGPPPPYCGGYPYGYDPYCCGYPAGECATTTAYIKPPHPKNLYRPAREEDLVECNESASFLKLLDICEGKDDIRPPTKSPSPTKKPPSPTKKSPSPTKKSSSPTKPKRKSDETRKKLLKRYLIESKSLGNLKNIFYD